MKRVLALIMTTLMLLSLCACGSNKKADDVYSIGIVQLMQHVALDQATKGFQDALTEKLGDMMLYDFFLLFGKKRKVKEHLSLSFLFSLRHLPLTFIMVVSLGAAVILAEFFPLFMMFLPAGFCWLIHSRLVRIENQYPDLLCDSDSDE